MTISRLLQSLLLLVLLHQNCSISFPLKDGAELNTSETKNNNFGLNDIFFDDDDDFAENQYLDTAAADRIVNTIDPQEIMTILNLIDAPAILELPVFLHTNVLNKRSLLDQPIFEPDRDGFKKRTVVGAHLFVRQTNRSNFTKNSTKLSSYVSLIEQRLISRLQNSFARIGEFFPQFFIDVEKVLNLFENMTVQERQAGFMVHFMKRWHKTTLRIMAPLYYMENNFSLTKREIDAVADELGEQTPEEEKAFRKAHFICDKIGMGDTRLEVDHRLFKRPSLMIRCGFQATIPTAFTWGSGFMGSDFPKPSTFPAFNLDPVFEAIESPTAENQLLVLESLKDFGFDSFDRLAADLLNTPLGNNRHLGVGVYLRGKTPLRAYMNNSFADKIKLTNRISVELFFPSTEKRFYINTINEQAFNSRNFEDLSQASENLLFLEEQVIERLFLRAFPTKIQPGAIFRWTSEARYTGKRYGFNLGTDFWIQDKNKLKHIYTSKKTINSLDVAKAKTSFAEQTKIFGSIVFKHQSPRSIYFLSLNADGSVSNKGLGQDYEVSLNFEASF